MQAPRPMETIDDIDEWDVQFLKVDRATLSEIATSTNYLDIKSLISLVCQNIAEIIQSLQTPEKVCEMLQLPNDLPPVVEEYIRKANRRDFVD